MQSDSFVYKFYYQWWKNIDKSLFLLISLLFIIGLFFSLVSTSLIVSDKLDTNSYFFFFKHLIYVLIGISLIFIFSSFNSDQLYKYSIYLFFISLISLFLVPFIGVEVKGSKRWIDLFFLPRFQPIEVLKPFLIVTLATILCSNRSNILTQSKNVDKFEKLWSKAGIDDVDSDCLHTVFYQLNERYGLECEDNEEQGIFRPECTDDVEKTIFRFFDELGEQENIPWHGHTHETYLQSLEESQESQESQEPQEIHRQQ